MKLIKSCKPLFAVLAALMVFTSIYTIPVHAEPEITQTNTDDSNSELASLSINGTPVNLDGTDISVTLSSDLTSINITGACANPSATVEGFGEFEIDADENNQEDFIVVVTSSDESSETTYTIHLTLTNDPVLFVTLEGEELGFVVMGLDTVNAPEGFTMTASSFSGNSITIFTNDSFPFSLVYLQNSAKKADWYCYQNGIVTGIFRSLIINKTKYYYAGVTDDLQRQSGYTYNSLNILGEKLNGWTINNSDSKNLVMLYLYDNVGNGDFYIYDSDNQTMQNRREFEVGQVKNDRGLLHNPIVITIAIIVVIALVFFVIILRANHQRSLKDSLKVMKNRKHRKNNDTFDVEGVELVRTSKVRIFAHPQETELPKKNKKKQSTKMVDEPTIETQTKIQDHSQILTKPLVVEQDTTQKLEDNRRQSKYSFLHQPKEPVIQQEEIIEEVVDEVIAESKTENKQNTKKIKFPSLKAKAKKEVKEKKVAVEETKEETKLVEEQPQPEKTVESKPEVYEEDPYLEIQKYIDQLFYLPDNDDK